MFPGQMSPWQLCPLKYGQRNLLFKFGKDMVRKRWDIADIEFVWVAMGSGGWWCAKSFSCESQHNLGLVKLRWGWEDQLRQLAITELPKALLWKSYCRISHYQIFGQTSGLHPPPLNCFRGFLSRGFQGLHKEYTHTVSWYRWYRSAYLEKKSLAKHAYTVRIRPNSPNLCTKSGHMSCT